MKLDPKDLTILDMLKADAKLTTSQIAKRTGIPITTVHNRIKKLEELGIVKGYTVVLDYEKLGKGVAAYILISVVYRTPTGVRVAQEDVAKEIKGIGAEEVSIVAGGTDIIAKVRAKDVNELNDFVIRKLRNIDGVDKTQTMIVLSTV